MDDLLTSYVRLLMNAVNKQKNLPAWEWIESMTCTCAKLPVISYPRRNAI